MRYAASALLVFSSILASSPISRAQKASIPATDPDFSIVVLPDTQYYHGNYGYVFQDQVNWVVAHQNAFNVKAVVGVGDIVDGGGYPVDSAGNVTGTCRTVPPSGWQTQWQQARSAINVLNAHGIYYQPTIGNRDYDCEADRPQPRSASNYFHHFGNLGISPSAYFLDQYGNRTPIARDQPAPTRDTDWLFEVVFDYGEHDASVPTPGEAAPWAVRPDPFSSYRAGFEVRTYRLCRRVLMFHRFAELGAEPCLVRSTDFAYQDARVRHSSGAFDSGPVASYLQIVTQAGYVRAAGGYERQTLPPLEFGYSQPIVYDQLRFLHPDRARNLPGAPAGDQSQWVDLDGEGVPGVLIPSSYAWYYRANLGGGEFARPAEQSTMPRPADLRGGAQLMDLGSDGNLDLVSYAPTLPGFFSRTLERSWAPFVPFRQLPNIDVKLFDNPATRRETLKMITGSAAAALGFPIEIVAAPQAAHHHPQPASSVPYVLKHFSAQQAQTIDALSDVIIPSDEHSPGAKIAKVYEYVDEIVSSSADSVKKLWMDGLAAIDSSANNEYGREYSKCTPAQQITIMEKISLNEDQPVTLAPVRRTLNGWVEASGPHSPSDPHR